MVCSLPGRICALLTVGLLALPSGIGLAEQGDPGPPSGDPEQDALQVAYGLDAALSEVYDKVAPSVVVLEVQPPVREEDASARERLIEFFLRGQTPDELPEPDRSTEGSGFVFRSDGYIMTNFHVVEEGVEGTITVLLQDGTRLAARVVGADAQTDLALLKVDQEGLPAVEFADSDLVRPGQFALAIGSPYELAYTVTLGIVSALKRGELTAEGIYEAYIQTDAAIHPGNSGGPLLDIRGRLIGINTMINGINRGLAFAIPSNMARRVGEQLIADGKVTRPWIGVGIETLEYSDGLRQQFPQLKTGVVVRSLQRGAPAARSELKPADVIVKVDGVPVRTTTDLQQEVLQKPVGEKVELEVWRPAPNEPAKGSFQRVLLETAERSVRPVSASRSAVPPAAVEAVPVKSVTTGELGVKLRDIESADRTRLDADGLEGVLVEERTEVAGFPPNALRPGDIVTRLEGVEVAGIAEFEKVLADSDASDGLLLEVYRDGNRLFLISRH